MILKTKLEVKKISGDCFLATYITQSEQNYVLEINYREGKFVSEKMFPNNYLGIAEMEEIKNQYKDVNDVKKYFGIV